MGDLVFIFIPLFIIIVQMGLMIWALVDVLRSSLDSTMKLIWTLIIVFVGIVGPILYFVVGKKLSRNE